MLNAIWAGMIVLGILYGAFTGNLEAVSNAALESAGEAVDLCITMCGIMGLWTGLMKIAQQAGSHTSFDAQLPSVFVEIYIRYASSTLIMTPTAVESSAPASVYLDLETRAVIK